ncbi:MAG: hypothetical protein KDB37_00475 [Ilumatobacter sp.]|nr:hypothetical protein [Ilumatobacter sp.]
MTSFTRGLATAVAVSSLTLVAQVAPGAPTSAAADVDPFGDGRADSPVDVSSLSPDLADAVDRSVQWRSVDLDVAALRAELSSGAADFDLFDDATVAPGAGVFSSSAGTGVAWSAADGLDTASFTIDGDEVRGTATIGDRSFRIAPSGDEHLLIEEGPLDADVGEPIPVPAIVPDLPTAAAVAAAEDERIATVDVPLAERSAAADGDATTIKVLTVYTPGASGEKGGDQAIQGDIAAIVDGANAVFANSELPVRLESVGIEAVDYVEAYDLTDDLEALTLASTDPLFDVHVRRQQLDADIVMMVRAESPTGTCGLAWLLDQPSSALDDDYAIGVIDTVCAPAPQYGYIHEVGHILGAGHGNTSGDGVFSYSAGFNSGTYRTIMAYANGCSCNRVPYFSAPRSIDVGPIGSSSQDNTRTIRETAHVVANFRPLPIIPTEPARFYSNLFGSSTVDGRYAVGGKLAAGSVVELDVAGRGEVTADAAAAMLNVTVVDPEAAGHVTVWPCADDRPEASSLNHAAGQTVPNAVLAKLDPSGRICIYVHARTHLIVDVNGYVPIDSTLGTMVPARFLETRPGFVTVDHQDEGEGPRIAGTVRTLRIGGRSGVPAGTEAVMLNVTAIAPDRAGHITVWPCDQPQPTTSNLNYAPGQVVANAVFAKLSPAGDVCIYTHATMHLVVDVNAAVAPGSRLLSVQPARLMDTRPGEPTVDGLSQGEGRLAGDSSRYLPVTRVVGQSRWYGRGGVTPGAVLAIVNVTAVDPLAAGHVTVYPCTDVFDPVPYASNLNYVPGQTVANLSLAAFGFTATQDGFCSYAYGSTHLIIDVVAYM